MKSYLLLISTCLSMVASAEETAKQFVGAPIDVSSWSYQRALKFEHGGVVALDVDAVLMAHASRDLRDVRIVRMGRQIPFLVVKPGPDRDTAVPISEVIDPKSPLLSKWDIQLPSEDLPISGLLLESATPMFAHTLTVSEQYETPQGRLERILGTASWQHQPGEPAKACLLTFRTAPHAATIRLATTDTNTPRAEISSARIVYPLKRLLFRVPDTEAVFLCYGNAQAINPRYELEYNRRDFDSGTKDTATLGPEEKPSVSSASINHLVGNATSIWDTLNIELARLLDLFDISNPWHLGGLILGVLLLLTILKKIFSREK
ncbi:MAG: hypothetical protein B7Z37_08735 [Verrucomicrobia bacterium 12-59-8]|nr:MAG: hypothetical protein B7Z37_08735 [Verrucomicrobia bacterium 12-59-8]